jgi:hypothetical protein
VDAVETDHDAVPDIAALPVVAFEPYAEVVALRVLWIPEVRGSELT